MCLAFNCDELFTRAKNQSSATTVVCVLHRADMARCPEGHMPQMGVEIKSHQLGLLRCIQPLLCRLCTYSNLSSARCECDMLLTATRQVFIGVHKTTTHDRGISLAHYGDKFPCCHSTMTPTERVKIGMKMFCSLP